MVAVFDGHNDALTRTDHALIASGRRQGHLDLPRMRAGGVRAAIFAVFTPSAGDKVVVAREDRGVAVELAAPVAHPDAAAFAAGVAGRLLALERAGELRVARTVRDLDDARAGDGPPAAVLHLEGAEAIDTGLSRSTSGTQPACARLGPSGVERRRSATGCRSCLRLTRISAPA